MSAHAKIIVTAPDGNFFWFLRIGVIISMRELFGNPIDSFEFPVRIVLLLLIYQATKEVREGKSLKEKWWKFYSFASPVEIETEV